jgi:hypothetical protein
VNGELDTRLSAYTAGWIEQHKTYTDPWPIDLEWKLWRSEIDGAVVALPVPGANPSNALGTPPIPLSTECTRAKESQNLVRSAELSKWPIHIPLSTEILTETSPEVLLEIGYLIPTGKYWQGESEWRRSWHPSAAADKIRLPAGVSLDQSNT